MQTCEDPETSPSSSSSPGGSTLCSRRNSWQQSTRLKTHTCRGEGRELEFGRWRVRSSCKSSCQQSTRLKTHVCSGGGHRLGMERGGGVMLSSWQQSTRLNTHTCSKGGRRFRFGRYGLRAHAGAPGNSPPGQTRTPAAKGGSCWDSRGEGRGVNAGVSVVHQVEHVHLQRRGAVVGIRGVRAAELMPEFQWSTRLNTHTCEGEGGG